MNDPDFTNMAERIGMALGKEMGGRFNVLASFSKEAGSDVRTLKIVDRWSDQDCTLTIVRGVAPEDHARLG